MVTWIIPRTLSGIVTTNNLKLKGAGWSASGINGLQRVG
ncbi:hypothetical protein CSC05_3444 [Escherichia coli]|nr:hypothetical protein CSC05_3444 [Escherichia coli]